MRQTSIAILVCALAGNPAFAADKLPVGAAKAMPLPPIAGLANTQIQSLTVSSNDVNLTGTTASITVSVNSHNGPCAADVTINGAPGATMYTVDSNPPVGNSIGYNGTLNFTAPGTYDIVAKKSSWMGPGCSGLARTTVKVSADANWPCSTYGFVKQSGGLLGQGQFICVAPNTPSKVATMACPNGTVFFNFGAMFGCITPGTAGVFFRVQ